MPLGFKLDCMREHCQLRTWSMRTEHAEVLGCLVETLRLQETDENPSVCAQLRAKVLNIDYDIILIFTYL